LPFLKIGTTTAVFQTVGRAPWSRDAWKMMVKIGEISKAVSCRNRAGRLSGPLAFFTLMLDSSWAAPSICTNIWAKHQNHLVLECGVHLPE